MIVSKRTIEYLIYILFLGGLFLAPFWGFIIAGTNSAIDWDRALKFWIYLLPAFILFFINNNLLMPFLLYKKRKRHYVLYLICIIALVYFGFIVATSAMNKPPKYSHFKGRPEIEKLEGVHKPPRMPKKSVYAKYYDSQSTIHSYFVETELYKVKRRPPNRDSDKELLNAFIHPDGVQILLIVFVLVFNICVRLFFLTLRSDEHLLEVEKQKLRAELDYLKYQINPHFFMNTLNNIHALIDVDGEKAQEAVIKLSRMMRHVLYEASSSFVPLEKEIVFMNSYIDLMRLRYTDSLNVYINFPTKIEECRVPSLLFVSFLENAFKHGVASNRKSSIAVTISVGANEVLFNCINSCSGGKVIVENSCNGIGIENVRKRLSLIYGDSYSLEIKKEKKTFSVVLKIPIQNDKMYIAR